MACPELLGWIICSTRKELIVETRGSIDIILRKDVASSNAFPPKKNKKSFEYIKIISDVSPERENKIIKLFFAR